MNKLKFNLMRIKNILTLMKVMWPTLWYVSQAPNVHFHLVPLWRKEDYDVAWKYLHEAHLKYARILNKRMRERGYTGHNIYNAGRKSRRTSK